jgi:prepilin-type N-terminal cleavage/methylation domain-containing protein/prepilin-type processing-associated H-X9-DG protein
MSKASGDSRHSRAFTLVELLVVIGIIALLIAILLPVLGKARESANSVKCQSQIRQIIQLMQLHANDHKGFMPLVGQIEVVNGSYSTTAASIDPRMVRYEFYNDNGTNYALGMPGSVWKYMGVSLDTTSALKVQAQLDSGLFRQLMVCPSDKDGVQGYTIGPGPATNLTCFMSYAFNEAALGWSDAGMSDASQVGRLRGNTAKFVHPSDLMLVTDAKPRDVNKWLLYYDNSPNCTLADIYNHGFPAPEIANYAKANGFPTGDHSGGACGDGSLYDVIRHRGRINIGCADGHVVNARITPGDLKVFSLNVDFKGP